MARDLLLGLVGLAGVVIGAVLSRRSQEAGRKAYKTDQLRSLIGAVNTLEVDAAPWRIARIAEAEDPTPALHILDDRWATLKPDLAGHAALDPDLRIRDWATELLKTVDLLLAADSWIPWHYRNQTSWDDAVTKAEEVYDRAHEVLFELARIVRGEGPPSRKRPLFSVWWSDPNVDDEEDGS